MRLPPAKESNVSKALQWSAALGMLLIATGLTATIGLKVFATTRKPSTSDSKPAAPLEKHPIHVRRPDGPPRVHTGLVDSGGNRVTAACSTCHNQRESDTQSRTSADLREFHTGMKFSHGNLTCLSCHNTNDYDTLKLADGQPVQYRHVMQLCGQCHGPQMKDYKHGAHGGMTGHWDLTRGPRTRNNCVDCHHPHTPQFPHMRPTFKPRDRFLNGSSGSHGKESSE